MLSVYVDAPNLYKEIKKKYSKKLNYTSLVDYIKDFDSKMRKFVYCANTTGTAKNFVYTLQTLSFNVNKYNPVQMTIDMLDNISDKVILCSNDPIFMPIIEHFKETQFIILASNILAKYPINTTTIEIPESMCL